MQASKSDKNTSTLQHNQFLLNWCSSLKRKCCCILVQSILMCIYLSEQKMPEGSWKCEKCNNINYPFRTKCNRQNCGADKPSETKKSPSPTPDENDQVCYVVHFCIFTLVKLLKFLVSSVHITIFNISSFELFTIDQLKKVIICCPFSSSLILVMVFDFAFKDLFFSLHYII